MGGGDGAAQPDESRPANAWANGLALNTDDHIKYINGYPDGTVGPERDITRAEVAMIYWRLLDDAGKSDAAPNPFPDVGDGEWYSQAVCYLARAGIIEGYADGMFKPDQSITRAEFIAMSVRFVTPQDNGGDPFNDINAEHWARAYIQTASARGWISGYNDGGFKPDNNITRAEAVAIVNRMLERKLTAQDAPAALAALYPDLPAAHWAYADMIEASVAHDYEKRDDGTEFWAEWTMPDPHNRGVSE
jgi:hypothetical protein